MNRWNLDQLKARLQQRKEVKGWIISQEHTHRRERYFLGESKNLAIDQDRDVRSESITARIFVKLPTVGRQGEISKKLFLRLPLDPQLDVAIQSALQTDHQAWELPIKLEAAVPQLSTTDPRMAEDLESVVQKLTQRISLAVNKARETTFNSAELFLSTHDRELHLSNGLVHRTSQSRIYLETAYSYARKSETSPIADSDEYLKTMWSVSLDDLPVEEFFDEASDRARHSLDVLRPVSGKFAVIVDSDVLLNLFHGQINQLSAVNAYNQLPFVKPGDALIPEAQGDLLTISLDPSLSFGADTLAISDQGVLQEPLLLVKENQVVSTATEKQYADYLKKEVTTSRGNILVAPGKLSHKELTEQAPAVLEVLQFSGLFSDSNTGTFSSEIRLAKLYDNKKKTVTYIKGGSLSGSIRENFKNLRLSNQLVKRAHFENSEAMGGSNSGTGYHGPQYALLSDVSIVS